MLLPYIGLLAYLLSSTAGLSWQEFDQPVTPAFDIGAASFSVNNSLIQIMITRDPRTVKWNGSIWLLQMEKQFSWQLLGNYSSGQLNPAVTWSSYENSVIVQGVVTGQDMFMISSNNTIGPVITPAATYPAKLRTATAALNGYLFTYGGTNADSTIVVPDLWGCDLTANNGIMWQAWTPKDGSAPSQVTGNDFVAYNGSLYEFGGMIGNTYMGLLYRLDLDFATRTYSRTLLDTVPGRLSPKLVMAESTLFILGGLLSNAIGPFETWYADLSLPTPKLALLPADTVPITDCLTDHSAVYAKDLSALVVVCSVGCLYQLGVGGYVKVIEPVVSTNTTAPLVSPIPAAPFQVNWTMIGCTSAGCVVGISLFTWFGVRWGKRRMGRIETEKRKKLAYARWEGKSNPSAATGATIKTERIPMTAVTKPVGGTYMTAASAAISPVSGAETATETANTATASSLGQAIAIHHVEIRSGATISRDVPRQMTNISEHA